MFHASVGSTGNLTHKQPKYANVHVVISTHENDGRGEQALCTKMILVG